MCLKYKARHLLVNFPHESPVPECPERFAPLRFGSTVIDMNLQPRQFHFSAASSNEAFIFGASRPGYPSRRVSRGIVDEWIHFMHTAEIARVVCLLDHSQLPYYDELVSKYLAFFGQAKVLWAPVPDYQLPPLELVRDTVLPFVREALQANEKTVIHCSAGCGRTSFMLAACLVALRGMSNVEAIAAVARAGRDACESSDPEVDVLLDACRHS